MSVIFWSSLLFVLSIIGFHQVTATQGSFEILVNAGGATYNDTEGNLWEADSKNKFYNAGAVKFKDRKDVQNTFDDFLYNSERFLPNTTTSTDSLVYKFPVPAGNYQVILYFAELWFEAPGIRVFDVLLQNETVKANLDIFKESGGKFVAYQIDTTTSVSAADKYLTVSLRRVIENPKISAIAIYTLSSPFQLRINCGAVLSYTDQNGQVWQSDVMTRYFKSGLPHNNLFRTITGSQDLKLFQTDRRSMMQNNLTYEIPVPDVGNYDVTMGFMEPDFNETGKRVFELWTEGILIDDNFDAFNYSGAKLRASSVIRTVAVQDGSVSISLVPKVGQPLISYIAIDGRRNTFRRPLTPSPSRAPSALPSLQPRYPWQIRINAGGGAYNDTYQNTWLSDQYFNTGKTLNRPSRAIAGTLDDPLYNSERYQPSNSTQNLIYSIRTKANANFLVKLLFAENTYSGANQRVFDIKIGKVVAFSNVDIFALAGGMYRALMLNTTVAVNSRNITIEFLPKVGDPKIGAIAAFQLL